MSERSDNQTPEKSSSTFHGNFGRVRAGDESNVPPNKYREY